MPLVDRVYKTFNFPGALPDSKTLITGIREIKDKNQCVVTGFYEYPDSTFPVISFVFKGNVITGYGKWFILNYPSKPHKKVEQTNLYGPDVKEHGLYNIVGNYTLVGQKNTIGCLYQGKIDGTGEWTKIIPKTLTCDQIINTICHSTMGNLVVGNYDTKLIQGKAFIYDIEKKKYYDIVKDDAKSITAYGIWHNKDEYYTIAGGYFVKPGNEVAYLVDWDNKRKKFFNWTKFNYKNNPIKSLVTHFDGISGNPDDKEVYTLTGDYIKAGTKKPNAFFAKVRRGEECKFKKFAKWEKLQFEGAESISGNSVVGKTVIGVFKADNDDTINGYVSYIKCNN